MILNIARGVKRVWFMFGGSFVEWTWNLIEVSESKYNFLFSYMNIEYWIGWSVTIWNNVKCIQCIRYFRHHDKIGFSIIFICFGATFKLIKLKTREEKTILEPLTCEIVWLKINFLLVWLWSLPSARDINLTLLVRKHLSSVNYLFSETKQW